MCNRSHPQVQDCHKRQGTVVSKEERNRTFHKIVQLQKIPTNLILQTTLASIEPGRRVSMPPK